MEGYDDDIGASLYCIAYCLYEVLAVVKDWASDVRHFLPIIVQDRRSEVECGY